MIGHLTCFIVRRPREIVAAALVLTALFAFGLRRGLVLDVSPLSFVERGSRERADFETARKDFGPDDYLVAAVVCPQGSPSDSEDMFAPANLEKLRALHDRIAKTSGVAEILSLINVPYARPLAEGASLEKLLPESFGGSCRY